MLKSLVLAFIITLAASQTIHCPLTGTSVSISTMTLSTATIGAPTMTTSIYNANYSTGAVGKITWTKPQFNDTRTVTINGWTGTNGTLYFLGAVTNSTNITMAVATGQTNVIEGDQNCIFIHNSANTYVFGTKDSTNTNFQVTLTSKMNYTYDPYVNFALFTNGYNTADTCAQNCTARLSFLTNTNDEKYLTQFFCWADKLVIGLILAALALVF